MTFTTAEREKVAAAVAQIHRDNPYRKAEGWQLDVLAHGEAGDCDSMAITAGYRLMLDGFAPERLALVEAIVPDSAKPGETIGHCLLQVQADDGSTLYADPAMNRVTETFDGIVLGLVPANEWESFRDKATPKVLAT